MQWIEVGTSDAWRQHREPKWSPHLIGWIVAEKINQVMWNNVSEAYLEI